ncbi:Hypothetical protein ETEE_2036 [Edwardsiella anguillarum ET080813]|uniref:Uncharacterized protein n=1 Tax=Edwardsiella anguillarum ET080813 TaxID=667120 RepID=A0A076LKR8_9GAMM|nr:Hypothetical protein ETEE_2036 [Edwardsiella anguillarum ET080813]
MFKGEARRQKNRLINVHRSACLHVLTGNRTRRRESACGGK